MYLNTDRLVWITRVRISGMASSLLSLTRLQIRAVDRIVRFRPDMAQYLNHECGSIDCQPMSESSLINMGIIKAPAVDSTVYVCRHYNVHICRAITHETQKYNFTVQLITPTRVTVIYNCPMEYEGSHMTCGISHIVIGINNTGISFKNAGYTMSDLVYADRHSRGENNESITTRTPDGEFKLQRVLNATEVVFRKLFDYRSIGPQLQSLRDSDIQRAVKKLKQDNKSAYNNACQPNLYAILESLCMKFRNITLEIPDAPYPHTDETLVYLKSIVTHCYTIKQLADSIMARPGWAATRGRTGNRRHVNSKMDVMAFSLAIIYWCRCGHEFCKRVVVPRVDYIGNHWPNIAVLPKLQLEKKHVTRVTNNITYYCMLLKQEGLIERIGVSDIVAIKRERVNVSSSSSSSSYSATPPDLNTVFQQAGDAAVVNTAVTVPTLESIPEVDEDEVIRKINGNGH
jgi:hypothetical protein